ncbi:MAG: hypothetical protein K2L56_03050 [Prevotella sp.]|nr:hypothetical protein [Prevotella sp.]
MGENTNLFKIADFLVRVTFNDTDTDGMALLPSFRAFRCEEDNSGEVIVDMTVDNGLKPRRDGQKIRNFDTGNGHTLVHKLPDGGYQFIIRDTLERDCCLLQADSRFEVCSCALNGTRDMRSFGLNDALLLSFAFATAFHGALLIHASCVVKDGRGYPFTAKSGTGKSTHTSLWMKHIENVELLNDDNPVIRFIDGEAFIYGSPWSGKTPCYRNRKARLGAVTKIERATQNSIERSNPINAFGMMLAACSSMKWDNEIYGGVCDTATRIIETTPIYTLHCLPDEQAAILCHRTIAR